MAPVPRRLSGASRAPNLGEVFTSRTQTLVSGTDGDPCSRGNTVAPFGYGNYSANAAANAANAGGVEALCRQMMGTAGAASTTATGACIRPGQGGAFITSLSPGRAS